MLLLTDQLVRTLSCKRVLEAASITVEAGRVSCLDRECGHVVTIRESELTCENPSCRFRAGNILDYLAINAGYDAVLRWLGENFKRETSSVSDLDWEVSAADEAVKLDSRRALHRFFIRERGPWESLPNFRLLKDVDVDQSSLADFTFYLSAAKISELAGVVQKATGEVCEYLEDKPAMVTPFYASKGNLVGILILSESGETYWKLEKAEFCYAGIVGLSQSFPCMHSNYFDAVDNLSRGRSLDRKYSVLLVRQDTRDQGVNVVTFSGKYFLAKGEGLGLVSQLSEFSSDMQIGEYHKGSDTVLWFDYLNHKLDMLVENGDSTQVKQYMKNLHMSKESRKKWMAHLQDFFPDVYEEISLQLSSEKSYEVRNATVTETPLGYLVKKGNNLPRLATNFTLDLQRSVFFKDSSDLFHEGVVKFKDEEYPVQIAHRDIHSARGIENSVLIADAKARPAGGASTPTIPDKQLASPLTLLLGEQASRLRRVEGVMELGWASSRESFQGIFWRADINGVTEKESLPHPNIPVLKNFSFCVFGPAEAAGTLCKEHRNILLLLVALTARFYQGRPISPVIFKADHKTQNALKSIFKSLGQKDVILLSYNARGGYKGLETLRGHPALVTGMAAATAEKCTDPVFLLAEGGKELSADNSELPGGTIIKQFQLCVAWIIETAGSRLPFSSASDYELALLEEGELILGLAGGKVCEEPPTV